MMTENKNQKKSISFVYFRIVHFPGKLSRPRPELPQHSRRAFDEFDHTGR